MNINQVILSEYNHSCSEWKCVLWFIVLFKINYHFECALCESYYMYRHIPGHTIANITLWNYGIMMYTFECIKQTIEKRDVTICMVNAWLRVQNINEEWPETEQLYVKVVVGGCEGNYRFRYVRCGYH